LRVILWVNGIVTLLHISHIPTLGIAEMEAAKVKRKNIFKGASARLAAINMH